VRNDVVAQELLWPRAMRWLAAALIVLCVGCGTDDRPDDAMAGTEGPMAATSSGSDDSDTTAQPDPTTTTPPDPTTTAQPDPTSGGVASTGQESTSGPTGDFERGQVVFMETCGRGDCHGPGGQAGPAPSLAVVVPQRDDARLRNVIQLGTGKTGKSKDSMPGLELEEQDLVDVIAYLRATFE
jgi:mono/diheme cytochrome c family protein